jgi:hypothetical protein
MWIESSNQTKFRDVSELNSIFTELNKSNEIKAILKELNYNFK